MRQTYRFFILAAVLALVSCTPKKGTLHVITTNDVHGAWFDSTYFGGRQVSSRMAVNYYVDSIRKAEQVKELRRQAGITDGDPLEEFFLKLSLRTLPLQSEGKKWQRLGEFTKVPRVLNDQFGYMSNTELQVMAMPRAAGHEVVMLLEMQDSITPALYLYTMNRQHRTIDQLCIYEETAEDRAADFGKTSMDYYITSNWEVV